MLACQPDARFHPTPSLDPRKCDCGRRYGALNAGNVCVGLLFYREHVYMSGTQLALALTGTAIILIGIGVGRLPPKRHDACRQSIKV